jgi:hypothetical protein
MWGSTDCEFWSRPLGYPSIYGSTDLSWALAHFSVSIFFTVGRTPWMGDQPVTRPLPACTGQHKHRINAHRHPPTQVGFEPTIPVFGGRRQFMPKTTRPLWSATHDKLIIIYPARTVRRMYKVVGAREYKVPMGMIQNLFTLSKDIYFVMFSSLCFSNLICWSLLLLLLLLFIYFIYVFKLQMGFYSVAVILQ